MKLWIVQDRQTVAISPQPRATGFGLNNKDPQWIEVDPYDEDEQDD